MSRFRVVVITFVVLTVSAGVMAAKAPNAPLWLVGTAYARGSLANYDGAIYKCIYAHTAMPGWEPPKLPGLWQPMNATGTGMPSSDKTRGAAWKRTRRMFAPYIHMTEANNDLAAIQAGSGVKFFTLAFIVADDGCAPAWQGKTLLTIASENRFSSHIKRIRAVGGDIIISFGGYVGQELAQACPDAASLQVTYQAVVDKYNVNRLDFDVEASAVNDPASIDRRSQALKALAAVNPGLRISFTLPAFPTGMPQPALNVLKSAVSIGTPVAVVNIMTMDYGYTVPDGNMGPAAISAATSALTQLQSLGLQVGVGITPMIGMNDSAGENFTPADARMVLNYARGNRDVVLLSMWSLGRDNGSCAGKLSPTCSGIAQRPWEFSHIFHAF